jgi:hypothetical protein
MLNYLPKYSTLEIGRMKNTLFRCIPPWTSILEVLSMLHIPRDLPCTFQKSDIQLENSATTACLLEPYYVPCKAQLFLQHTDEKRWITILRQILDPHGWEITAKETTQNKKKVTLYTIQRNAHTVVEAIHVDFS